MLLALGLAGVAAGWQAWIRRLPEFDFADIPSLPGWRLMVFDGVTRPAVGASQAVFIGIDAEEALETLPVSALCKVLYPGEPTGLRGAYFTDVNCPNCRRLETKLAARAHRLQMTTLDLPLLGENSRLAAKAAIAAELQGRGTEFRQILSETGFAPQLARRHAVASGLDPDRLLSDIESGVVQQRLQLSRRAAETLGIYGTPALTIGRTLIMGDVPAYVLDSIMEIETESPFSGC